MTLSSFFALFFRHLAYASALLLLVGCLAERLAPGSVLSYIALWQLVAVVLLLQLIALAFTQRFARISKEGQRIILFAIGLMAIGFLAVIVKETGLTGILLIGTALAVLLLGLAALPRQAE
jgi:hypothetical protein